MTISDSFVTACKKYAKISVDADDDVIKTIIEAAAARMESETGKTFSETDPVIALTCKMIFCDWYQHRGTTTTEALHELPLTTGCQTNLNLIALSSDYPARSTT